MALEGGCGGERSLRGSETPSGRLDGIAEGRKSIAEEKEEGDVIRGAGVGRRRRQRAIAGADKEQEQEQEEEPSCG